MIPSGFFRGRVSHRRARPTHTFDRDLVMALVDVESVDAAPNGVLQLVKGLPISLRRQDHLPAPGMSLSGRVRELVTPTLGRTPRGPMVLLSQPRAFGLTFDPVSFVYCLVEEAESISIEAVVAEVTNTPWGERHAYVLTAGALDAAGLRRFEAEKCLHVSPFFDMDHSYTFRFSVSGESATASISNHCAGELVFEAGLALERVSDLGSIPWRTLARHPWMPAETMIGIYAQAARLAWKGARFHPHPRKRSPLAFEADARVDTRGSR